LKNSYQISVALCTYNGAKYIDEQLQSIIDQDHPPQEIIVVDDQSTDNTIDILNKWRDNFPHLFKIFINEKNVGFDKNFEKAISFCSGELISIADQDDIWMKDKLALLAACFTNPKVTLAHGASLTLKNGKLHYFSGQLRRYKLFEGSDSRKLFLLNQLSGHNIVFRKTLLLTAMPIPDNMYYDWWLAVNATAQGEVCAVKKYLVHHRKHGQNAFFSKNRKKNPLTTLARLRLFKQINLSTESTAFLNEFIAQLTKHNNLAETKFDWVYFKFLLKHSQILFGHKKRISQAFTYLTDSIKFSK
jgi:glycosyltransferase involved in cell wall biosynthesis